MSAAPPPLKATLMILALLTIATLTFPNMASAQVVSISTDSTTYGPGDQVTITGQASRNSFVALQVSNPRGTMILLVSALTDDEGKFTRTFRLPADSIEGPYTVTASEGKVTRSAVFNVLAGPVRLSINITPDKPIYKDETIVIDVIANKILTGNPLLTISQTNAQPLQLKLDKVTSNQWTARYTVQKGFDGPMSLDAVGQDALGNKGSASKSILVDSTPPTVTISAPKEVFEPTISITGTVDDADIANVQLFLNDEPLRTQPVQDRAWSTEVTFPYPGTHKLTAVALDFAGNEGSAFTTVTVARVLQPINVVVQVPSSVLVGSTATIWIQTSSEGKSIVPTNLSASVIQPDGTEKPLSLTAIAAGVFKATFTATREGNYLILANAAWRGAEGTSIRSFQTAQPPQEITPIVNPIVDQVERARGLVEKTREDLGALLDLVIIAIALSVAAAGAAIAAVLQITRKLVLK